MLISLPPLALIALEPDLVAELSLYEILNSERLSYNAYQLPTIGPNFHRAFYGQGLVAEFSLLEILTSCHNNAYQPPTIGPNCHKLCQADHYSASRRVHIFHPEKSSIVIKIGFYY
jgi:hypothetical protein